MRVVVLYIRRKKMLIIASIIIAAAAIISAGAVKGMFLSKNMLEGKTIVIDAGHGGIDKGANNQYIFEKDINLDVALRLQEKLESNGARVIMTRTEDIELARTKRFDRERYLKDLNTRVHIINNSSAQLFLSIHTNSNPNKPSTRGMLAFYAGSHPYNREIAYLFQNLFNNNVFSYEGNTYKNHHFPQSGRYYLLINAKIPGILIETGFITNSTDVMLLKTPEYKDYISDVLLQGITNYFSTIDILPKEIDDTIYIEDEHTIDMSEEDKI